MMARLIVILTTWVLFLAVPLESSACFTMAAGKKATQDGSILLAHNEDNGPQDLAGMRQYDRKRSDNGQLDYGYVAIEMPYLSYSDNLINEHGLALVSNLCKSREDKPEISGSGVGGRMFRHHIARRAKTARQAVRLVGALVEKYGYADSGRTLTLCDPDEAWMMALVQGKHWVAARVPDDEIAIIANTYTIHEIDLADPVNYLGSKDIIQYAIQRRWYHPEDGAFDFEKAYASPGSRTHPFNLNRQWAGATLISGRKMPLPEQGPMPFSLKPESPVSVEKLFSVLRNHDERTGRFTTDQTTPSPHAAAFTICNHNTNYSSVYQLRPFLPKEVGLLWWCALWNPCSSPYLPLYPFSGSIDPALKSTLNPKGMPNGFAPAYQLFYNLRDSAHRDFAVKGAETQKHWFAFEKNNFRRQVEIETGVLSQWTVDRRAAKKRLSDYSKETLYKATQKAQHFVISSDPAK